MVAAQDFATLTVYPIATAAELGPWTITVQEVIAGSDAFAILTDTNAANAELGAPAEGESYVLARISATNTGAAPQVIQMSQFAATGTDGILRRTAAIAIPEPQLSAIVQPGESTEGWIAPIVNDPASAILWFDSPILGGTWSDALFALAEGAAPAIEELDPSDTDTGSDVASPASFGDTLTVDGWEITIDDVLYGADMFDAIFDFRTRALGSNNDWITAGAAVHAVVRNLNPFPAFFSSITFEVADWSGEPWDQMPTLTVTDDVSREYMPGGSGSGWAAFAGLAWTEYNLLRVSPVKVTGNERFLTFGDTPPANNAPDDEEPDSTDEPDSGSEGEPSSDFTATTGDMVVTSEDLVNLRADASTSGDILQELPLGTELEIAGEAVEADGHTWYQVIVVETGETGFVVADFLEPAEN